jgi:hypothetical protein
MFPLIFLLMACIGYTILGMLVLACAPNLRFTVLNLVLFVAGAFPGGLVLLFLYGRVFARESLGEVAFFGIFPVLVIGGVIGGGLMLGLKMRFESTQLGKPPL